MSRTVAGRHFYALGGNEQAAYLGGIRADSTEMVRLLHRRHAIVSRRHPLHRRPGRRRPANTWPWL